MSSLLSTDPFQDPAQRFSARLDQIAIEATQAKLEVESTKDELAREQRKAKSYARILAAIADLTIPLARVPNTTPPFANPIISDSINVDFDPAIHVPPKSSSKYKANQSSVKKDSKKRKRDAAQEEETTRAEVGKATEEVTLRGTKGYRGKIVTKEELGVIEKEMEEELGDYRFVPISREAFVFETRDNWRLVIRTRDMGESFKATVTYLVDLAEKLKDMVVKKRGWEGLRSERSDALDITLGTGRFSQRDFEMCATYSEDPEIWRLLIKDPELRKLCGSVGSIFKHYSPRIYQRYEDYRNLGGVYTLWFGVFSCITFNLAREGTSVICRAHTDGRNIAIGYCFIICTGTFDSSTRFFLTLPDLRLTIEFPFGTMIAIPSALLLHLNTHSTYTVTSTQNGADFQEGEGVVGQEKRGSIVLFTPANNFISAENDGKTAAQAGVNSSAWGLEDFIYAKA